MIRHVVFARTRHTYDSYADFWRLVDVSGFPTRYVDEVELENDAITYIFTPINGEVMPRLPAWRGRRCKLVWWNLERPEDETLPASLAAVAGAVDAVWVSDRHYAAKHAALSYALLAGHPGFGTPSPERIYDVCTLAYLYGRRREAVDALVGRGVRIAPAAWGKDQQDGVVAKSHLMLNLHQYEGMTTSAPLRFAVAASYAVPIASEIFYDADAQRRCVSMMTLPELVRYGVTDLLRDTARLAEAGYDLHRQLCVQTNFAYEVVRAAARI